MVHKNVDCLWYYLGGTLNPPILLAKLVGCWCCSFMNKH